MATFNSTISGSNTGDTLIGTESDQLILGGTAADSIGSQYSNSCLVGSGGNDTFFVNSTVLGVGAGTTMAGGSGSDSFDFGTYSLVSSCSPTRTTTRSAWLDRSTTRASMGAKERTAFNCATRLLILYRGEQR